MTLKPETSSCVLIVEDEPKLVRLVKEVLSASGYQTLTTNSGKQAIEMIALHKPDLVLLDIVLIDEIDGYEVTHRVREFSSVPIIMLTAKARESDLLHGFEAGADDYLAKPFSAKELLARIKALLSRERRLTAGVEVTEIKCGDIHIDLSRRQVKRNGNVISMTRTEYELLFQLATHANKVMLHEQLLSTIWGPEYQNDVDYLRAYIRYLRKKLEADPSNPKIILTEQGVGYLMTCPEDN
jgi:two-component system KDP operon response regulator KdpE